MNIGPTTLAAIGWGLLAPICFADSAAHAIDFDLVYPNYRGLIFPGAGDVEVDVKADVPKAQRNQTAVKIALEGPGLPAATMRPVAGTSMRLRVSPGQLAPGTATLRASLVNTGSGETRASRTWPVRVLTAQQAAGLKVYIDRNNNTIVDGKPFFPLGWYGAPDEQHLREIADGPFNCLLDYGTDLKPKEWMLKYLDEMQRSGLKLIYCMNDVYPTATYLEGKNWEGITGNQAIADAVVQAYREHPAILAWYLNDELSRTLAPKLEACYSRVRELDPNHPCYIVLCDMKELPYFPQTTDVIGVDPYPIPKNPVTMVSDWMDAATAAVRGHKPVWLVPQAFAWYQYKGGNRGRTPTEAELQDGRAPTYEEERCMTWLALARGAKGLIYYCYYDLRVLPQYQQMWGWMKKIAGEVREFSPVLLSGEDLGPAALSPGDAPLVTRVKRQAGTLYVMAVNAARRPVQATLSLPEEVPAEAEVLFEGRSARVAGRQLADSFKPLEVHLYRLAPPAATAPH